jgi:pimeloyl-ACP methyl ester carboxylesterase
MPAAAQAALDFKPCGSPAGAECASMDVPIDRSGSVAGTLPLLIQRVRATEPNPAGRAPIVFLAGGPGQTNTDITELFAPIVRGFAPDRDILSIALRGTGPSAIDCFGGRSGSAAADIAACGNKLGPARNFYTTRDTVDDIESVRAALGVPKLSLYGTSYGTYQAYAYAVRHPDGVESLVLDSTVAPDYLGDVFYTRLINAIPGVARALCSGARCKGISKDPYAGARKLSRRLHSGPATGRVYDAQGKRRAVTIAEGLPESLLAQLDEDENLRAELPRSIAAALHHDYAPLARLVAPYTTGPAPDPRTDVNLGLYFATVCEEDLWPWDRTAAPADRIAQAHAAIAAMPASAFAPFSVDTVFFGLSNATLCAYWPMRPDPPSLGPGSPPDVPVLLVHGRFDIRTPLPATQAVAGLFPQAKIVEIPAAGHSAIRHDPSGCASKRVKAFLAGLPVASCTSRLDPFKPRALAPRSLKQVRPAGGVGGNRGRALRATTLTVQDVLRQLDAGSGFRPALAGQVRGGGLRGGSWRGGKRGPTLKGVVFVPGVAVSGRVPGAGTAVLELRGRVRGTLRFAADGKVTGKLAGKRVHAHLALPRVSELQALDRPALARRFWRELPPAG